MGISVKEVFFIMMLFMFAKAAFGKSLHYKQWYKCLICSLVILATLFGVFKFNIYQSMILTLFCSYVMTNRANVKNDENTIIKSECKSIYEQLEKPLNLPALKK